MNKKLLLVILILIIFSFSISFYYLYTKLKQKTFSRENELEKILSNPNEYLNYNYLKTLTIDEKQQLFDTATKLFFENCEDGKLNEKCSPYFVNSYLIIRCNCLSKEEFQHEKNILNSIYLDLEKSYEKLTENDLSGFTVPLITTFCLNGFNATEDINLTSEVYDSAKALFNTQRRLWAKRILDVEKNNWESTVTQIYYIKKCMAVNNKTFAAEEYKNHIEIIKNICNILPTNKDVNQEDLCYVFDYLNVKNFCEINITSEDSTMIKNVIQKKPESNYQNICKSKLVHLLELKGIYY